MVPFSSLWCAERAAKIIEGRPLMATPKIVTHYDPPPIPNWRQFARSAVTDNYEGGDGESEPGDPIGHGATEAEAIADLIEQLESA